MQYYAQQQLIECKDLQKQLRQVMKGPVEDEDVVIDRPTDKQVAAASARLEFIRLADRVAEELTKLNKGLGVIFTNHCGVVKVVVKYKVLTVYRQMFEQVSGRY
jgi:hypothetical protein